MKTSPSTSTLNSNLLLLHNFVLFITTTNKILKASKQSRVKVAKKKIWNIFSSGRRQNTTAECLYTRRLQLGYVPKPNSDASKYQLLATLLLAPSLQSKINDITSLN
jgi:hypothetical protein